jgi:hypothetical protein
MPAHAEIQALLNRAEAIPARLSRLFQTGYKQASAGEWSADEIFIHIRASNDILSFRVYAVLTRDNPPLPVLEERRWAEIAGYHEVAFPAGLAAYTVRRAELMVALKRAADADWDRIGTHEIRGQLSLFQIVTGLVDHEEEHCAQLETMLAS